MKDVIILGAGIAGLSAGFELYKNDLDFQILETSDRVGGSIETLKINDCLIETGPHTFSSLSQDLFLLIKELGIEEFLHQADPNSKNRYIYFNHRLISVPTKPVDFFKTEILSRDAKWTIFEELFIKKEEKEESVEDFISRRFGVEVLRNLVQPFLNGVYAGDVKKLSANAVFPKLKELENKHSSIILGAFLSKAFKKMTLYSFADGMEFLPQSIYERIKNKIVLNAKEIEIVRAKDFFIVTYKSNNKTINYTTNSILFAVPAYRMKNYNYLMPNNFLENFLQIEYAPISVVNQLIDRSKVNSSLNGFGFLCTSEPHRKLLGTIYTSSVFPNRSQDDKVLLTSYIGGAHYKKVINQTEEEIKNQVAKELAQIMHISNPNEIETLHVKTHINAIPQYNIGHLERIKKINELMNTNYGLFFCGNYLNGISINDTIKTSRETVKRIKKQESLVAK